MVEHLVLPKCRFIGVAGIIGAGKSTLTNDIAARIPGAIAMHEPVPEDASTPGNPYLSDFYREPRRHAFAMQVYLLRARYRQHLRAALAERTVIQDRTIYEDTVFAEMMHQVGHIDARDFATYLALFEDFSLLLQRPDLIVYLDVDPEVALERVRRRARPAEKDAVTLPYLVALRAGYESWIERTRGYLHVVRVAWDEFLPVESVLDVIATEVPKTARFIERFGRKL